MGKFFTVIIAISFFMSAVALGENRALQGVIKDESGKPVSGAELYLYDSLKTRRPADFISAKTGPDGRYFMNVPSGVYWGVARVRHGVQYGPLLSGDLHSGEPREIILTEANPEHSFTVADIRETSRAKEKSRSDISRVNGTIRDQFGQPVSSATVYVWSDPFSERIADFISSWSEDDGEYSLYLLPGRYRVMATQTFPPTISGEKMVDLVVTQNQKDVVLNLQVIKMENNLPGGAVHLPSGAVPVDAE
jgi:hypothetical protein